MRAILTVAAVLLLLYFILGSRHPVNPPGPAAPHDPVQTDAPEKSWRVKNYTITALARYHIEALILSTERYWIDSGADLSPIDFAVGWGPLSDQAVVDQLSISQGHRWFWLRWRQPPLSAGVIMSHCANMHMIPADSRVEKQLKSIEKRDVVDLAGYLVEAAGPNHSKWRSSLTRTDTGSGSCELMWVEEVARSR